MSCSEIVSLLVGATIGLVSSSCILLLERFLDKKGKMNIYYKITGQKSIGESWGIFDMNDGSIALIIPVVYEIQNTSNITRVVRDVSLYIFYNDNNIGKMYQSNYFHITKRKGSEITNEEDIYFGGEKGSYSFVVAPRSINRFECEYMLKINKNEIDEKKFNKITLQYYDEKSKAKKYQFRELSSSWKIGKLPSDEDWVLLK